MRRAGITALVTAALVAALAVAASAGSAPARAAEVVAVPDSIDGTGSADVTRALNELFARVPAGARVEFPAGGRYRVEGILQIDGLVDVVVDGRGSTLFAETDGAGRAAPSRPYRPRWPRLRQHVAIRNAAGLTLEHLAIRGPNRDGKYVPALEGQAGIAVQRSERVLIARVEIAQTYGDGVYVTGGSRAVAVRDSRIHRAGRQGVAVVHGDDIVVERSRIDRVARSVFDLEPITPRSRVRDVHLRENRIGDYGNFLLAAGGAGPNVTDVRLERNLVTGGNGIAVFAGMPRWTRRGLHVVGNRSTVPGRRVRGTGRDGVLQIVNIDGVEITGNRQRVDAGTIAVTLDGVCNLTMRENEFPGAAAARRVTGRCGEPSRRGSGDDRRAGEPAPTDRTWLLTGFALGALGFVIMAGLLLWRRRGSPG